MKKIIIAFLPIIPTLLLFLELGFGIKIPYLSLFEPIRILLENFGENSNFKINNSAFLGFFVSILLFIGYLIFLGKYIKFSIFLPKNLYFGNETNNKKFLEKNLQKIHLKNIFGLLGFYFLAFKIIKNKDFSISNESLHLFDVPRNFKGKLEKLNIILKRHIGEENFIKNIETKEDEYVKFFINKGKLTSDEIISKFKNIANEVQKLFSNENFEAGFNIISKKFDEIEIIIFNKNALWINRDIDFTNFSLKKGEILLGFLQKVDKGVKYLDYKIFSKNLNHLTISASSRSGKDVVIANLILSILYNIKNFGNMELHFFDTKGVDASYLENMKSCGIYRYKNISDYPKIFEKIESEMTKNAKQIEEYSNIYNYNEKNPKNPIKEKFIIINEFLALNNSISAKELNSILKSIIALTSQGAGFGYKVIIMSQTIRKDISSDFASILANIKTRFILKSFQNDEVRINTRGLGDEDVMRILNMKLYNCFHIEDNEIKQEFKAYLLEQEILKEWIVKNFEAQKSEILPEKIQDYYNFARKNDKISHKEAKETFSLSQKEWEKFINFVEENKEIARLPNNTIVWKNGENTEE